MDLEGVLMRPKLILIEGLPGTGKSTLAQWLAEQYRLNEIPVKWHYELSTSNPLKADEKIVAQLSTKDLFAYGLRAWERCVDHARHVSEVTILDAGLFQHITMEAFRRGCSKHAIYSYLNMVDDKVLPLQPLMIYVSPDDATQHIEQTYLKRGERFKEIIVNWCNESADARRRGYCGYDGSILFWNDFNDLCKGSSSIMRSNFMQVDVEVASPNWPEHQKRVLRRLEVKPIEIARPADLNLFLGTYLQQETSKEFTISWENGDLYATGILDPLEQKSTLIPTENNRLLVRGHDIELEFSDGKVFVHSGWRRLDGCVFTTHTKIQTTE
jgi:thymidylate kinase